MKDPLVTVIVPAYNAEMFISDCIESVRNQTLENWELIVIDDGSNDNTGSIADAFALKDFRIQVIHQQNRGVSAARNAGIDAAKGEYITFLDSDDLFAPICLEALTNNIENTDLCVFPYAILHANESIPTGNNENISTTTYNLQDAYHHLQKGGIIINSPGSRIFQTQKIRENGIRFREDLQLAEDLFFNLDYLNLCNSVAIGKATTYYYRHDFSTLSRTISLNYGQIQSDCYLAHKKFTSSHQISTNFFSYRKRAVCDVLGALIKAPYSLQKRYHALKAFSQLPLVEDYLTEKVRKTPKERMVIMLLYIFRHI